MVSCGLHAHSLTREQRTLCVWALRTPQGRHHHNLATPEAHQDVAISKPQVLCDGSITLHEGKLKWDCGGVLQILAGQCHDTRQAYSPQDELDHNMLHGCFEILGCATSCKLRKLIPSCTPLEGAVRMLAARPASCLLQYNCQRQNYATAQWRCIASCRMAASPG